MALHASARGMFESGEMKIGPTVKNTWQITFSK